MIWNTNKPRTLRLSLAIVSMLDVSKEMRCRNGIGGGSETERNGMEWKRRTEQSESLKLPPKSNCGEEKSISGYPRISISPATLNKVEKLRCAAMRCDVVSDRYIEMVAASRRRENAKGGCWKGGGGFGIKINKHKGHTWYADEQRCCGRCGCGSVTGLTRRLPRAPFKDIARRGSRGGGGRGTDTLEVGKLP